MFEYVYDFLSLLFDKMKRRNKIKAVILFGSAARNTAQKSSDVDIFIDVDKKDKPEVDEIVKESLNEFEIKSEKTWKLRGIKNAISVITDDIAADRWGELRRDIASYGIVLYGKYQAELKKNKHCVLIKYDTVKTKQKEKVRMLRKLLGYQSKKGKRVYKHQGLIEELHAEKLSSALIIDVHASKEITTLLKEYKVPFTIKEM